MASKLKRRVKRLEKWARAAEGMLLGSKKKPVGPPNTPGGVILYHRHAAGCGVYATKRKMLYPLDCTCGAGV